MRVGKQILFSFSFLCVTSHLPAQVPSLYFDKITNQSGLSNNKVNCILQDTRGFIWLGTDDGLNRYDGNNFTIFRNQPANPHSISGNMITDLLEDKSGILWIATADGGLTKYDYRLSPVNQFVQYKHHPSDTASIPVNVLNALLEDHNDNLWIATSGAGVLKFNKETRTFARGKLGPASTCLDLAFDRKGMIWVGRQGGGIMKINPVTFESTMDARYQNLYAKLPHPTVTALYTDEENNVWFGSWDRILYRFNHKTQEEEAFQKDAQNEWSFGSDEITSFTQDHERNIWMGGRNSGLHVYNKKLDRFYNYQYDPSREGTLADNRVNCIYIDRSGIVWIGTNKGVSIHNPSQQQFRQTFLPKLKAAGDITINDFYSDRSGHLWLATSEGLFLRRNGESSFTHKPLSYKGNKLNISKFFLDADGRFYLGTNYSLFSYDVHGNNLSLLLNTEQDRVMNKIIASRVVSVIRDTIDNKPVLLVSPYGHFLAYYDLVAKRWISRLDSTQNIIANFNIRDNLIRRFYRNSAGKIWLATVKEGLGEWVKNSKPRIKYYKNDPGRADVLSNNNVFDIAEDKNGILWITTYGGGLHYFDQSTGRFTHIGASSNLLEGMQIDSRGFIWMVGNGNLHRYDPTQRSYTSFDLPDIEKSGGVRGYIYKDASGRMYVGGLNYFVEFNPLSIRTLRDKPKVYFTDFKIFNNSYSDLLNRKNVSLNYNQNYFTIEFSAPHYSAATRVQYAYQLEGIDENWIEAGERNSVPYSNLPAGGYVFKVKATNNPGNWNDDVTTINITIVPPFWKTWWFYMICGVFTIMMVYGVYRYRINELLKRQAIRNKIAQDLHDNMGSTLSSISVYSQVAKIQQSKGNYEVLENVLGKIASTSSEMISEMNDIVWAINPRNDSMEKILQRMESFAKPLLAVKNIQFSFNYTADIFGINLEMQKRKNFYLIFKESVNNALKYSGCTSLDVNIGVKGNQLHLTVQDNGAGFERRKVDQSSQSLSGNGLRNMEMRAKEMKGSCSIESHPGKGTTVNLWFPIP